MGRERLSETEVREEEGGTKGEGGQGECVTTARCGGGG